MSASCAADKFDPFSDRVMSWQRCSWTGDPMLGGRLWLCHVHRKALDEAYLKAAELKVQKELDRQDRELRELRGQVESMRRGWWTEWHRTMNELPSQLIGTDKETEWGAVIDLMRETAERLDLRVNMRIAWSDPPPQPYGRAAGSWRRQEVHLVRGIARFSEGPDLDYGQASVMWWCGGGTPTADLYRDRKGLDICQRCVESQLAVIRREHHRTEGDPAGYRERTERLLEELEEER